MCNILQNRKKISHTSFKRNVQEKFILTSTSDKVLADIFGVMEGLDCMREDAFDDMLHQLKEVWEEYEQPFAPASVIQATRMTKVYMSILRS